MPLVFISPFKRTYSSNLCSLSTILGLFLLVASILLPLFAAFSTDDFWLRLKEYTEQPLVDVDNYNNYMIYLTDIKKDKDDKITGYKTYFYSSNTELNDKFKEVCTQPQFGDINNCEMDGNKIGVTSIQQTDIDEDGINDKLTLSIEIQNPTDSEFQNEVDLKIMFFIRYGLIKKVKLLMTPMIYINLPLKNPINKEIILNGNLELVQKSPIVRTAVTNQLYNEQNPFEIKYKDASYFDLLYYYHKYKSNNYTVKYNYEKIEKKVNDGKIKVTIVMNIPKMQQVFYVDSVFEALKYAWMQYFYIFLPIYIILYMIFKFIIKNNIFYSDSKSDL